MKRGTICGLILYSLSGLSLYADPINLVNLGTASSFAVLGAETVTNTGGTNLGVTNSGATDIWGNLGVSPGSAVTGFLPGIVHGGTIYLGGLAAQAQLAANAAYLDLAGRTPDQDHSPEGLVELGGLTLTPGVYKYDSAGVTGTLYLDALGDPNALFIFQFASTLMMADRSPSAGASAVITINSAECCNVYWQFGSSATLGTYSNFQGTIIALTSITLRTGAEITDGRALALNGAVTLDTNNITNAVCETTSGLVPEPGTIPLLGAGLFALGLLGRTSRKRAA